MRQTLLFGGLESIVRNANRKNSNLRFFEFGNCYRFDGKKDARRTDAGSEDYWSSVSVDNRQNRVEGSWGACTDEGSSFYELKACVENILRRIGVTDGNVCNQRNDNIYFKGLTLQNCGGRPSWRWESERGTSKQMDIDMGIINFADLNWTALMKVITESERFGS